MSRRTKDLDAPLLEMLVAERLRVRSEIETLQLYELDLDDSIASTLAESRLGTKQQLRVLAEFVERAWAEVLDALPHEAAAIATSALEAGSIEAEMLEVSAV